MITLQDQAEMNHIGLLRAWQLGYALEAIAGEVADDGTLTHQRAVVALLTSIRHALDGVTMIELGVFAWVCCVCCVCRVGWVPARGAAAGCERV